MSFWANRTVVSWPAIRLTCLVACVRPSLGWTQTQKPPVLLPQSAAISLPAEPAQPATVTGLIQDVDQAAIPNARLTLENTTTHETRSTETGSTGQFAFAAVPPGRYTMRVRAPGFAAWKVEDLDLAAGQTVTLPDVTLGVEALTATVDAITQEDLAEQQITEEEHQRILGVLPNFYVSYLPDAAPLTRKQKFKLAIRVSTDPVTFFTTGVTAAIAQAQGDFAGYGPGIGGYGQRYAAVYGDRLSSTFFGAAVFPSLFHQDPRYFYRGHGSIPRRALYAISTVAICKGDNGRWQPNYSNVFGNLAAAGLSSAWYPPSSRHSVQVTVSDTLLNVATGAFGTLFQEFALRHFTRGGASQSPKP